MFSLYFRIFVEMNGCHYEFGSEALFVRTLASPTYVKPTVIESDWSVTGLLDQIAEGNFHALIDTGALITGMTNEEVARYLLRNGLKGMKGCVYLDNSDEKMVVLREGGKPIPLDRCGVAMDQRFTFYDQVHTTYVIDCIYMFIYHCNVKF